MRIAIIATSFLIVTAPAIAGNKFLVSPDGTYLGKVNGNQYDPNSVSNPYGQYGSRYSQDSVNNPYGQYGSQYSNKSANNPYATQKPFTVDDD